MTAGADAEGEGRAPSRQMAGQFIVRGRQQFKSLAILLTADGRLVMLNTHPDGKIFLLHGHSCIPEHAEGIPCRMAGGQNQGITGQPVFPRRPHNVNFLHLVPLQHQALQPVPKTDITPQGDKFFPHGLYHPAQHIRAHVGLVGVLHIPGGSRLHQGIQHRPDPGVMGTGGQLSVGESTGTALSKLDIGALIQLAPGPEFLHIRRPGVHILPPLQHDGRDPIAGQKQGGKQPRRSHTHHHGRHRGGSSHTGERIGPPLHQGNILPRRVPNQPLLLGHGQLHRIDVMRLVFIPGVNGLPDDLQLPKFPRAHPKGSGRPLTKLLQISSGRQGQVSNADHAITILFFGILSPIFSYCIIVAPERKRVFPRQQKMPAGQTVGGHECLGVYRKTLLSARRAAYWSSSSCWWYR